MLLTKSISNTKKFFQKSMDSLKSFFSGGQYQKLPKAHPYSNPDSSPANMGTNMNSKNSFKNQDLDKFCSDLSDRRHNYDEEKEKKTEKKKTRSSPSPSSAISTRRTTKQERDHDLIGNFMRYSPASPAKNFQVKTREDYTYIHNKKRNIYAGKRSKQENNSGTKGNTIEARSFLVAQQIRELQMMDVNNVDHELDIEEVLFYYSRLTCPAYVELVDKFFMEIYAEFFAPRETPLVTKSRQLVR